MPRRPWLFAVTDNANPGSQNPLECGEVDAIERKIINFVTLVKFASVPAAAAAIPTSVPNVAKVALPTRGHLREAERSNQRRERTVAALA
ncbi:MAG: hypothetical protein M3Q19_01570 [Pseudomonadota bacterium]|nr:hypothetical protein [Pseudomonadota bacterium]